MTQPFRWRYLCECTGWKADYGNIKCIRGTGGASDETCNIEFIDVETGDRINVIEDGFRVDWGSNNRLLYSTTAFGGVTPGIYEIDLNDEEPAPELLIRNWANQSPFHEDNGPAWSPDGERLVLIREVAGFHYSPEGGLMTNKSLVLYSRDALDEPQFLLLADHGNLLGQPVWTPDGRYILYTLVDYEQTGTGDVWWVDVATSSTGRLTTDGASIAPSWRPPVADDGNGDDGGGDDGGGDDDGGDDDKGQQPRLDRRLFLPTVQTT